MMSDVIAGYLRLLILSECYCRVLKVDVITCNVTVHRLRSMSVLSIMSQKSG